MSVTVRPANGINHTEYTIRGEFKEVCAEIEGLFKQYNPLAYGTKVRALEVDYPHEGTYIARVWRAASSE